MPGAVWSFDLELDVGEAAALGEPAAVAATVHVAGAGVGAGVGAEGSPPVVCFARPGAGFTRHYFTDDLPGPVSGAQAEWHAARGWVFVSVDHLGVGGSSTHHEGSRLDHATVTAAAHAADLQVLERLAAGTLHPDLQVVADPVVLGIGQSMGGALLIAQQARSRTYDGIGVLGYSAVHTSAATRPGFPTMVLPWIPRHAQYDDTAAVLNVARVLAAAEAAEQVDFLEALTWVFHYDDVDAAAAATGRWNADGYHPVIIASVTTPGVVATEAAAIEVPVLVALGERDGVVDPKGEPRAYLSANSVDLFVCPRMAHMHNFAGTRELFWERIDSWARWVTSLTLSTRRKQP
jgi:alpha-beta hydrolase superfamily lysophospholipase